MQDDKQLDSRVAEFFVENGCKEKMKNKLVEGGFPVDKFEEAWPGVTVSMAFFLTGELLKTASNEVKVELAKHEPASLDRADMSLFTPYFLSIIQEVKKLPTEQIDTIISSVVDGSSQQVIKGYQMARKQYGTV